MGLSATHRERFERTTVRWGSGYAQWLSSRRKGRGEQDLFGDTSMVEEKKRLILIAGLTTFALGAGGYFAFVRESTATPRAADNPKPLVHRQSKEAPLPITTRDRGTKRGTEPSRSWHAANRTKSEKRNSKPDRRRPRGHKPVVPVKRNGARAPKPQGTHTLYGAAIGPHSPFPACTHTLDDETCRLVP